MVSAQEVRDFQVTEAKVISFNVNWPGDVNREALVFLQFTLNLDGTASDISVLDTGFHEKRFVDAAIKGLRNARFSPRTVNGVPEPSYGISIPVRFSISGQTKGITADFRAEVLKVSKLIDDKDYAGAQFHAQWMLAEKVNLLFEYAVLQATLANTYARVGEKHAALAAAQAATARTSSEIAQFTPGAQIAGNSPNNYLLNKDFVVQLLQLRMVLASSLGFSVDALKAYSELAGLGAIKPDGPFAREADRLTRLVLSGGPLIASAKLNDRGNWIYEPYRHTFAVRNVQSGPLTSVGLTCQGHARTFDFKPDVEWTIPESWNTCSLTFEGGPGTTFQIVETVARRDGATAQ